MTRHFQMESQWRGVGDPRRWAKEPHAASLHIATDKSFSAITQHRGATIRDALEDWVRTFSFVLFEEQNLLTEDQIAILKRDIVKAEPRSHQPSFTSMWFVFSKLGKKEPILDGVFGIEIVDTVIPDEESRRT